MGAPVVRFEIMGGKGNQLEEFYKELFGWKIDSNNPMQDGMVDTGSSGGINGGVGASQHGKIALRCISRSRTWLRRLPRRRNLVARQSFLQARCLVAQS